MIGPEDNPDDDEPIDRDEYEAWQRALELEDKREWDAQQEALGKDAPFNLNGP